MRTPAARAARAFGPQTTRARRRLPPVAVPQPEEKCRIPLSRFSLGKPVMCHRTEPPGREGWGGEVSSAAGTRQPGAGALGQGRGAGRWLWDCRAGSPAWAPRVVPSP